MANLNAQKKTGRKPKIIGRDVNQGEVFGPCLIEDMIEMALAQRTLFLGLMDKLSSAIADEVFLPDSISMVASFLGYDDLSRYHNRGVTGIYIARAFRAAKSEVDYIFGN